MVNKKSLRRIYFLIFSLTTVFVSGGCYIFETKAPDRGFGLENLLIDELLLGTNWKEMPPFFPAGDDLCTTDCAAVQFELMGSDKNDRATQLVYKYNSTGIARRTFQRTYLPRTNHLTANLDLTATSPLSNQSYFGCGELAGDLGTTCEWAGQYEEFIVVFRSRDESNKLPLEKISEVINSIDSRMAEFLNP